MGSNAPSLHCTLTEFDQGGILWLLLPFHHMLEEGLSSPARVFRLLLTNPTTKVNEVHPEHNITR